MYSIRYSVSGGLFLSLLFLFSFNALAQTKVKGYVKDSKTKTPIEFVNVFFPETSIGTTTNEKGYFEIESPNQQNKIKISSIGHRSVVLKIRPEGEQTVEVSLVEEEHSLNEVVVKPPKVRYRNKDNPAVELIRQVVAHKAENRSESNDYVEYESYEKIELALQNTPEKLKRNRLFRSFKFMVDNIDTTTLPDKALMPIYLEERITQNYYRKKGNKTKRIIKGEKKVNFGEYLDNAGLNTYLKHIYQDIDIYDNNITVMTNQFLSPIATLAPTFYQFFIVDTIEENNTKLVGLSFYPRNKTDMLFQGRMYITIDGRYAVQKVTMTVNRNINLNWVRDLDINLDFVRANDWKYHLIRSELKTDFGLSEKRTGGIYGKRVVSLRDLAINEPHPDKFYNDDAEVVEQNATTRTDDFWNTARHDSLTVAEQRTYSNIESLTNSKSFKRVAEIATLLLAGYKHASPYVEIGPANTFYSYNPVEGFRLRLGGRTTPNLSKRITLETYAAHGFKDRKWKYYLGGSYSFTHRSIFEFPSRVLRANYQEDTKIPGQELQFVQEDNVLLSIKRGVNDKWLYNKIYVIDYLHELRNHFSVRLGYKNWQQEPAGQLKYTRESNIPNSPEIVPDLTTSELVVELRWAPNEEFYQGKLYRIPMPNRYPIFTLRGIAGLKGFLNGQSNYQNITANIYKRLYLSQLGYSDVVLEGGTVLGTVPFPLLAIHRANQTYSLQLQSYNLMNFLEFVSDHYASLVIDHCFNGFIFNKIPIIKKTRLREFVNLKVLYGGIRAENLPANNKSLLTFPTYSDGRQATYSLEENPYIEGSVGIGNILNFFRVDLVKRFTYLDNPHVSGLGLRMRFKFDF
ncbi:MAG: carboxypeptidase-like regulatory domain-containing protein [Flavipsychrobacter sp.]|nr:carboxypeptidase-like regulatory domain-containing protein [Flavipsychrobacter sp.]